MAKLSYLILSDKSRFNQAIKNLSQNLRAVLALAAVESRKTVASAKTAHLQLRYWDRF